MCFLCMLTFYMIQASYYEHHFSCMMAWEGKISNLIFTPFLQCQTMSLGSCLLTSFTVQDCASVFVYRWSYSVNSMFWRICFQYGIERFAYHCLGVFIFRVWMFLPSISFHLIFYLMMSMKNWTVSRGHGHNSGVRAAKWWNFML